MARIKLLIEQGVLMPGSRIPERQLCAQLGISRTPLREAFRILAAAGLLEVQPRRGATVKRLRPDEIDHMFEVLEALEGVAGELACERMSDDELAAVVALVRGEVGEEVLHVGGEVLPGRPGDPAAVRDTEIEHRLHVAAVQPDGGAQRGTHGRRVELVELLRSLLASLVGLGERRLERGFELVLLRLRQVLLGGSPACASC